jgi:glycosyltransferase involved in cell wall biosynthesis
MDPMVQISVLIPTLNEARTIGCTLERLQQLEPPVEVIVVDGFSSDQTGEIARSHGAYMVLGPGGRGAGLKLAASRARGNVLWFLHADTLAPLDGAAKIIEVLKDPTVVGGNFAIKFDGMSRSARFLTWLYPHLKYLGLVYGDSGIFVRRQSYDQVEVFDHIQYSRTWTSSVGFAVSVALCVSPVAWSLHHGASRITTLV